MVAEPHSLDERAENGRLRAALTSAWAELAATRSELAATRTELAALVELATRAQQQRDAADARTSELTAEVGRLAQLVGQTNERVSELLAIAQRSSARRSSSRACHQTLASGRSAVTDQRSPDDLSRLSLHPSPGAA